MAKSRKAYFYFITLIASIVFSFIAMELAFSLFPAIPIPQDLMFGGGIILSYVFFAKVIRAKFFPASPSLAELLPRIPPLRAAALLFIVTILLFPALFVFVSFMETVSAGHVSRVSDFAETFLRIFPVKDYFLLLLQVPIFAAIVAVIYNRISR